MKEVLRSILAAVGGVVVAIAACASAIGATAVADPGNGDPPPDDQLIRPLPTIVPQPSDWVPKFPYPYNQTRQFVKDVDINMERELCQWYNAQYDTLIDQIDRLQFNRIQQFGPGVRVGSGTDWDYSFGSVQEQADIVTANLDRADQFLAPRVQAFTINRDFADDTYFPLYQAKSFFLLWQNLANVNNGIKAHQPNWYTGPSVQFAKKAGSDINRSHVCR